MKQLYKKIGSYLILCIASVCFLLPFYLMICSASDGNISLSEGPIIPGTDLWENICYILFHTEFLKSLGFTLRYTIICSLYLSADWQDLLLKFIMTGKKICCLKLFCLP